MCCSFQNRTSHRRLSKVLSVNTRALIRRMVLVDGISQREVAKRLGHSRNSVADAVASAEPRQYSLTVPKPRPVLEPVLPIIRQWLADDRKQHRKQRHTAVRIYERLRDEYKFTGSRRTVSDIVKLLRSENTPQEVFVPIEHQPGAEVQIDWGEAQVILNGKATTVMLFCARLAYSKATFVRAYLRQDQPSFLDGHVHLMNYLGGVPTTLAYDNLKSAVIKVMGRERQLNRKFVELRSHYLFQSRFCNVAKGNEKGHTENAVKRAQRNYLTPPPSITSIEKLNEHLLKCCCADLARVDKQCKRTYGELLQQERAVFSQLPASEFQPSIQRAARVDRYATVQHEETRYSVPSQHACKHSIIRVGADTVEVIIENQVVVKHMRADRGCWVLELEHYLPVLERKPGLLDSGKAFVKASFTSAERLLRSELEYRYQADGTKRFLQILMLSKEHAFPLVREAIENCVKARLYHEEAVRLELERLTTSETSETKASLDVTDRPDLQVAVTGLRDLSIYDLLASADTAEEPVRIVSFSKQGSAELNVDSKERDVEPGALAASKAIEECGDTTEPGDGLETSSVAHVLGGVCFAMCGVFA